VASHRALHRGDGGGAVHVLEANNDITEAHRLREELRQRVEEMAGANRAREEFLAMLSHDLRNPLAPILNAVHVMRMIRLENPILRLSHSMIEREMRQMGRLVNDLLDMSRITRGKVQLRKESVELCVLVDRSVERIQPLAQERRHQVTVNLPNDPVWLDADPVRAEQVLVNLLTNAVRSTVPGGKIWVTAAREGDRATVRVKDTGVGITPELLPRVFHLFSQAERPIDRSQGGLGLGLALSRMLVERVGPTTPKPFGAKPQTCPHWAVPGPPDGSWAVRAAERGAAIRCSLSEPETFPEQRRRLNRSPPTRSRGRPHPDSSDTSMARVGFRPRSLRLSPSTRERLRAIWKTSLMRIPRMFRGNATVRSLVSCDAESPVALRLCSLLRGLSG
jgi:hypothetical protein